MNRDQIVRTWDRLWLVGLATVAVSLVAAPARADRKADSRLEKQIEERLGADERLKDYALGVKVEDGVASLHGKVALDAAKVHAGKVADIPGARRVDNQIEIDAQPLRERLQQLEQQKASPPAVAPPPAEPAGVPPVHSDNEGLAPQQPVELAAPPAPPVPMVNPEKLVRGDVVTGQAASVDTSGDQVVTAKVMAELMADEELKGSGINVEANEKEGLVTLKGTVPSELARARAVEIVKTTAGVQKVNDLLRVGPRR